MGFSEVILWSSLKSVSEDALSDVIRLLENPRVGVNRPTGWYLILFIIKFCAEKKKWKQHQILRGIMQQPHWGRIINKIVDILRWEYTDPVISSRLELIQMWTVCVHLKQNITQNTPDLNPIKSPFDIQPSQLHNLYCYTNPIMDQNSLCWGIHINIFWLKLSLNLARPAIPPSQVPADKLHPLKVLSQTTTTLPLSQLFPTATELFQHFPLDPPQHSATLLESLPHCVDETEQSPFVTSEAISPPFSQGAPNHLKVIRRNAPAAMINNTATGET